MIRHLGFYWVIFKSYKGPRWEPAEWNGEEWLLLGTDVPRNDDDTLEIGPEILRNYKK